MEKTFLAIKPDAVAAGAVGQIVSLLEGSGFRILGVASRKLSVHEAARFYDVHAGKPFFDGLIEFVTSGMTVALLLEAPDAVRKLRSLVGATDPAEAAPGTMRASHGTDVRRNAVHASDSPERVEHETAVYFNDCPRTVIF